MIIRDENINDIEAINNITIAAFKDMQISDQTEHHIVKALRAADALTISLVAEIEGEIIGHIAFSPITISDGTQTWYGLSPITISDGKKSWYGLGPISVRPDYQKQGIGSALIKEGLSMLKEMGGCVLVGDPNYYGRFGFRNYTQLVYEGIPQEFFLALPFNEEVPSGLVKNSMKASRPKTNGGAMPPLF